MKKPASGTSTIYSAVRKTGLGGGNGAHRHLLGGGGSKQKHTAEYPAQQRLAPVGDGGGGRTRLEPPGQAAPDQNQPRQKHTGQPAAAGQKGVGPHIAAAHCLGHKGNAPDQRAEDQQQGVANLMLLHNILLLNQMFRPKRTQKAAGQTQISLH